MATGSQTGAAVSLIDGSLTSSGLLRALERIGPQPAVIECTSPAGETASLWLHEGRLLDVQLGWRSGLPGLVRLLTWHDGRFRASLGPHDHADELALEAAPAIAAAADQARQWRQAVAGLGGLEAVFEVNFAALAVHLMDVPDEANALLRLLDGQRCVRVLLDAAGMDELQALGFLAQLAQLGIIRTVEITPPATWTPEASRPIEVQSVQPEEEAALLLTPVIETVALPPALPADAADESLAWAHETTAPTRRIPVYQFPSEAGSRRRRQTRETAALQEKLARRKDRATLLTREVLAPGAVIPPGLTEAHLTDIATEVLATSAVPFSEAPTPVPPEPIRKDDDFERFFQHQQQRFRILALVLVLGAAVGALGLMRYRQWAHREAGAPAKPALIPVAAATPAPPPTPQTFDALLAAGLQANATGRPEQAIAPLEKAAALQQNAVALRELGIAYYKANKPLQAVDRLRQATVLDGRNADAFMYLGTALQDLGRYGEARRAYQKFLTLEPAASKRHAEIAAVLKNLPQR